MAKAKKKSAKKRHSEAMNKKAKASASFMGGMESFIQDVKANKAGREMVQEAKKRRKKRMK